MNVTLPNGTVIEGVPEGISKEDVKAKAIAGGYATEEDFGAAPALTEEQKAPELDLWGKLAADYKGAFEDMEKDTIQYRTGQITFPEMAARGTGEVAGMFFDTIGNVAVEAIPDFVKEGASEGWDMFAKTELGKEAVQAMAAGGDALKEFAENNPRAARNLEAVFNVGALVYPVGKSGTTGKQGFFHRKGGELVEIGDMKYDQKVFAAFEDLGSVDNIKRTLENKIDMKKLNPMEQRAIRSLKATKKFDYAHNPWANIRAVNGEIDNLTNTITNTLSHRRGMPLNTQSVLDDFTVQGKLLLDDTIEPEKMAKALSDVQKKATLVLQQEARDGRLDSLGMWNARKRLDKWFNEQVKGEGFETRGPMSKAVYAARNAMNKELKAKNPGLTEMMDKQSGLLYAQDGIAHKAAQEAKQNLGTVIRTMEKVGFKGRATSVLLGGLGLTGGGGALAVGANPAAIAGLIGASMLGNLGLRKTRRALGSVINRTKVGEMMTLFDQGIQKAKKAKNSKLVKELRTARSMFISLSKDFGVFEQPVAGQTATEDETIAP